MPTKQNEHEPKNPNNLGPPPIAPPIVLEPPKQPKWVMRWHWLTWWRPLTKKEGADIALMILKLGQGMINMENTQKRLIYNNNILTKHLETLNQQIHGYQKAKKAAQEAEKKRMANDQAFQ